jgi:hypothetical protein
VTQYDFVWKVLFVLSCRLIDPGRIASLCMDDRDRNACLRFGASAATWPLASSVASSAPMWVGAERSIRKSLSTPAATTQRHDVETRMKAQAEQSGDSKGLRS